MKLTSARRVASRFALLKSAGTEKLEGSKRLEYLDDVWAMYEQTYRSIGLHIPNSACLLKYGVWELEMSPEGHPVAFNLFKKTSFGLKSGLAGHDGSSLGKRTAAANIRGKFKRPGVFGEVSHKVKAIALAAGAPAVCAAYADDVTGKTIELYEADPISYSRILKGVGKVTKTMIGNPKGVPTTDASNPSCPIGNVDLAGNRTAGVGSLLSWGDGLSEDEETLYDTCAHCSDVVMSDIM